MLLSFILLMHVVSGLPEASAGPELMQHYRPAEPPTRIISMAPSVTETLYALGQSGRLAGVTNFCDYPEEAKSLPRIGGWINPNIEAIVNLKPDLLVTVPTGSTRPAVDTLMRLDVPVLLVMAYTVDDVFACIRTLGTATHADERAEQLCKEMQRRIDAVRAKVSGLPPRRVLFVWEQEPLIVGGGGTYMDELITLAGGTNIAGSSKSRYPHLGIEEVIIQQPEVILDAFMVATGQAGPKGRDFWGRWPEIPAVRDKRIHHLESLVVTRPGPRLPEALEAVARAIHPEAFGGADGDRP
ncbi:ABC transporter substrate-binding protein [Thermodesulfobacteriota bacterium]